MYKHTFKTFIQIYYVYVIALVIGIISIISFTVVATNDIFYLYDKNLDLKIDSSYKLNIKGNYTNKNYHFYVENEEIATIDSDGNIKTLKQGETKVIVKSKHKLFTNEINLNVSDFTVYSITFELDEYTLRPNDRIVLAPIINYNSSIKTPITWTSSEPNIVSVDEDGVITGKDIGFATITATSKEFGVEQNINVNVINEKDKDTINNTIAHVDEEPQEESDEEDIVEMEGITLNTNTLDMYIGDVKKISSTITPSNTTNKKLIYTSSNTKIATVDNNGLISAKGKGICNIDVQNEDGKISTSLVVNVKGERIPVTNLSFKENKIKLYIDENYMIVPIITPTNASVKDLTYTISNDKVATVDSNGLITALTPGNATVVGVTKDGHVVSSIKVEVQEQKIVKSKIGNTKVENVKKTMLNGDTNKLKINITDENNRKIKYYITSSNKEVIKVSQDGTVSAVSPGMAFVRIDTVDGSYKREILITVLPGDIAPELIYVNKPSVQVLLGNKEQLEATVIPENAKNKTIIWSSANESVATVDSNGLVTATGIGTTSIVTQIKDTGIKRSIKVSVVGKEEIIDIRNKKMQGYYVNFKIYDKDTTFMRAMQNFVIYNYGKKNESLFISMPSRTLVKKGINLTGELKKDLLRTNIVYIPKSELKKPESKKRKYMFINYGGHGQTFDIDQKGTLWVNGNGFITKDSNGSYWGSNKSIIALKFKSNKEKDKIKNILQKITIKKANSNDYYSPLEMSFDIDNDLAAIRNGRNVFIYKASDLQKGKKTLMYSFVMNTKSYDGTNYSRQGHAISNGYYYQYRGTAGSKMYIEVYNYVGQLQYTHVFNPKTSGQEAEGLKIYDGKIFVGIAYNCKGCNGKTNSIYYFR